MFRGASFNQSLALVLLSCLLLTSSTCLRSVRKLPVHDDVNFRNELKRQDSLAALGYWFMVEFVILDSTYREGEDRTSIPMFGIKTTNISNMELEMTGATCSNVGSCDISIGQYCLYVFKENEPRLPPGRDDFGQFYFQCAGQARYDFPCVWSTGELIREYVCMPRRRPGMLGTSLMGDTLRYVTNSPLTPGAYWLHVSTSMLNPLTYAMYRVDYENPNRIRTDSLRFLISSSHE